MDINLGAVELTELEKLEVTRVDAVGRPANGFPVLLMKGLPGEAAKDWADWDAAHEGGSSGGKGGKKDDSKADASAAVARARQTIADHKAGKKVDAADLKNAHDVHEAHLEHEAKLKADAEAKAKARATAKAAVQEIIAKAADRKGNVDEAPDIQGGTEVIAMIADLIIAEAQELKAGNTGEIRDIQQLACAAEMIWCWRSGEEAVSAGSVMPATALMQSARFMEKVAKGELTLVVKGWDPEKAAEWTAMLEEIVKAKHSAADRRKLAEAGNALSDGSYPIEDEHDLKSAAILAQSGHGDVEGAKRLIGRRAKELGVKNPLEDDKDDAAKAEIAKGDATVDTGAQGTGDLAKVVEDAIAKATAPLEKLRKELEETLAKVRATPVPGGPVLSRNVQVKQPGGVVSEDTAAKAALMRQKAAEATAPSDREGYLAYARELDEQARTKSA